MRPLRFAFLAFMAAAAGCARIEEVSPEMISPKVVSIHTVDASSPEAVVASIIKPGMSEEEKALAIWRYCWRHTYHWQAPKEGARELHELDTVVDATKLVNVYGYTYCFAIRSMAEALYQAAGFEARTAGVGGHVIPEVYYHGKYHYLDNDQRGFSRLPDGSIASLADYRGRAAELLLNPTSPSKPFFPSESRPRAPYEQRNVYVAYMLNHQAHWYQHEKVRTTHSMNMALRPGERFTRGWGNVGKWNWKPGKGDGYTDIWKGPSDPYGKLYPEAPRAEDGSPLNFGNGLLVYRPDLSSGAGDFAAGVHARNNLNSDGPGFRPARRGRPATADFRVRLPYVIAGWPGDMEDPDDNSGAAVVSGRCFRRTRADRVRVLVSLDEGATWREVWKAARTGEIEFAVDLTSLVEIRYGYQVRFELLAAAKADDARVLDFGIDTACQLNPPSLPAVRPGENKMTATFEPGPEVFEEYIQYGDPAAHGRMLHEVSGLRRQESKYSALAPARGKTGHVTYVIKAPPGRKLRWVRAGAAFRSTPDPLRAPDEVFRIYYAVGRPSGWKLLWEGDPAPYLEHWCFEANAEVPLTRAADRVYVRYEVGRSKRQGTGGGKLVAARLVWGASPAPNRAPRDGVEITHVWKEPGGAERSLSRTVKKSGESYSFKVDAERVENVSIAMELAGRPPAAEGPHPLMLKAPEVKRRDLHDPAEFADMYASLARLDKSPTAETAADIMKNCANKWTRNTMPTIFLSIGGQRSREELKKLIGENRAAEGCYLELLAIEGPTEELTVRLKKTGAPHRAKAARLLTFRGDASAVPALRAAIAKEDNLGALAAEAAALVRLAGEPALVESEAILGRCRGAGRVELASALAAAGSEKGLATLVSALEDDNRYIRFSAADALAASGRPDAEAGLITALKDESHWVRRAATSGLAALGGKASLKPLAAAAKNDPREDLREEARWALEAVKARCR